MSDKNWKILRTRPIQIAVLSLSLGLTLVMVGGCSVQFKAERGAPSGVDADTVPQPESPVETAQTTDPAESVAEPIKVQDADEKQEEVAKGVPQIEFDSVEYDFGEVVPRAKAVGHFKVTNAGNASLEISEVKKCCGATLNWAKKTLKPGESSALEVTYTFVNVGAMKKNLYVSSNDPDDPRITLTIKGSVARKVSWTPTKIRLFLNEENAGVRPIQIKSLDGKPFAIKQFTVTGDIMSADVDPSFQATEFSIVPKVDVDKLAKMEIPQGRVQIFHTHPGAQTIGLNYDLLARFRLTPPRIIVFSATPEKKEKRKLWVLDNYPEDESDDGAGQGNQPVARASDGQAFDLAFEIDSVQCEKGSVTVLSTGKIKNGYQLSLEIAPPEPEAGSRSFTDALQIKIKGGKELSVAVMGYYSNKARSRVK